MMKLKKLFEMQRELDTYIIGQHELEGENLTSKRVVAFIVELGELANELRFFKYWSNKGISEREIVLEEYIDGLHFLLSLGLQIGADAAIEDEYKVNYVCKQNLTEEFLYLNKYVLDFNEFVCYTKYRTLLDRYLSLSRVLLFTEEEVMEGYFKKNAINHERQNQGY